MKKIVIIHILVVLLFVRCANVVPLQGGIKDENAPKLKYTNLTPLNFSNNEIKLTFNEYIEIENNSKNITLQPFHSTLSIRKNKKDIIINIDSTLKENTTYVLNITNGIKDVNEGNLYSYFYTFSTGNTIDTGAIKFIINNNSELKNYKIGIVKNELDSFKKISFNYLSFFTENSAVVNGLKTDRLYKYYIFKDENKDDIPDEYTAIYFDTITANQIKKINLNIWVNETVKKIAYKNATKYIKNSLALYTETYDESLLIYKNNDSALYFNSKPIDSLNEINIPNELKKLLEDKIITIKDKNSYNIQIPKKGIKKFKILDYQIKENENTYDIINKNKIDSLRIVFNENDTQILKLINTIDINKISDLKISIKDKNKSYKLLIYKNNELKIHETITQTTTHFYLEPGEYEIKIYEGNNLIKTTINPHNNSVPQPAKVNKKIVLKANWEEEILL